MFVLEGLDDSRLTGAGNRNLIVRLRGLVRAGPGNVGGHVEWSEYVLG